VPHLTLQISPTGPVLELFVGVSLPRSDALKKAGLPVPNPVKIRALIDTGASCTSIDPSVLKVLGVVSTGVIPIHTPSTVSGKPHLANQFDASLVLPHPLITRTFFAVPVIESALTHQGIQALLGRDILRFCLFAYDGEAQTFCLAF
jgi:hypothetical protein